MSDSKSTQVSRTLLSILADFNNAVVWVVSTCPLISKSSVINIIIIWLPASFSCQRQLVNFHWTLRDTKSFRVSRTLSSIHFNNAVVCMVLILFLLLSYSTRLFSKPLSTVPSTPTIFGITVTLMFHSFFSSFTRSNYLSSHFLSFLLSGLPEQQNL